MTNFKCPNCLNHKENDMFHFINDKRQSICKDCNDIKLKYYNDKKDFKYTLNEDWKEHPVYKGYYCDKLGHVINGKTKKLMGALTIFGYIRLTLYVLEKKHFYCHRFIYETWIGDIPDKMVINHINEKKCDNRLENLELVTKGENTTKSKVFNEMNKKGQRKRKPVYGTNTSTNETFNYKSLRDAERQTDIGHPSIQKCCDGITKSATSKSTGDKWTFNYKI
jgi:hypothetical protein